MTGHPSQARALHLDALALARDIHSRWDEANILRGLAATHRADGNLSDAEMYLDQAIRLYKAMDCAADVVQARAELSSLRRDGDP